MPNKMPNKMMGKSWSFSLLFLGFAVAAAPAHAGFEWIPPAGESAPQQSSLSSLQPIIIAPPAREALSTTDIISPVIITGTKPQVSVVPLTLASTQAQVTLPPAPVLLTTTTPKEDSRLDLATATISVAPTPMPPPAPVVNENVVQGFATQVPLPIALRQVLPIGYTFSIDPGINMDTLVSYKGGRSWRETLKDMLTDAGLVAHEQGKQVAVGSATPVAASGPISLAPAQILPIAPARNIAPPAHVLTMPASAEMPASHGVVVSGWSAQRGDTLRQVLTDWCHRASVELQWQAEYDYPVEASVRFNGNFEDAVRSMLAGFDAARPQPIGELHANPGAGQMVLVIQARGNNYSN